MSKKKKIILGISIAVILCIVVVFVLFKPKKIDIEFVENNIIEYGSKITSKELVKETSEEIISYPHLDTKKIGKQKLVYEVKDSFKTNKVSHEIIVKDTQRPVITLKEEKITLNCGDKFVENENIISVKDVVDGDLKLANKLTKGTYTIASDVDSKNPGTYEVKVSAQDINKNITETTFQVIVKEKVEEAQNPISQDPTQQPQETVQPYYVNGVLLVNKKHPIPRNFGGNDAEAGNALAKMQAAASLEGHDLGTLSGYRSYDYQANLYNNYVARDGKAAADRYSAQPGKSEHQTGMAFDIGQLDDNFGNTPAGKWLATHAHEYGFIIRYPKGKEHITGYMYEPWHVRYLGVSVATSVYQSGLTLEEYLGDY